MRNPVLKLLIVSISAALAIILASALLEGAAQTLTYIIVAIWWIPYSILSIRHARDNHE